MSYLKKKLDKLKKYISSFDSAAVAYSGGVDSALLLKMTKNLIKKNVIAVTSFSKTFPEILGPIKRIARKIGVRHIIIKTHELNIPEFRRNSLLRCYYCKRELFKKIRNIAKSYNIKYVFDGTNYDDITDTRPGSKAIKEYGVISPFLECKITKPDIRKISKHMKLPTWNKPQMACLSSRIPYGTPITPKILDQIKLSERYLNKLGFNAVRVRHHNSIARIEVPKSEIKRLVSLINQQFINYFKRLGYKYITIDLEGYRTGSLNEKKKFQTFN